MKLALLVLAVLTFGCAKPCPPCPVEPGCGIRGDINHDGAVDGADYTILMDDWGKVCD